MRSVSGDKRPRRGSCGSKRTVQISRASLRAAEAAGIAAVSSSGVAVAVTDAVKRLNLRKIRVDHFEFFAQTFDMAVYCTVIDVDVLAISAIHQLIAAFHMAGPHR